MPSRRKPDPAALAAALHAGRHRDVVIDSRQASQGSVFVALPGTRTHGNAFLAGALEQGADLAVADKAHPHPEGPKVLAVDDPARFLWDLGLAMRRLSAARFVGLTGSFGKTTTKDMIALALGHPRGVLKTEGNLNNQLGVPLTLCRLREHHRLAVVELGASVPGDIDSLAGLVRPHVAVLTGVGDAHLEGLGGIAGVAAEKSRIFAHTAPEGAAVLPADALRHAALRKALAGRKTVLFGLAGEEVSPAGLRATAAGFAWRFGGARFRLGTPARHNLMNAQAAVAVARELGVRPEAAAERLARWEPAPHRMRLLSWRRRTVLDDCYNANPVSLFAAVQTACALRRAGTARVFAAVGDMLELGPGSTRLHGEAGRKMAEAGVDFLVAIGTEVRASLRGFDRHGGRASRYCGTASEAAEILRRLTRPGDVLLVKGSRGMHLEHILEELGIA